MPTDSCDTSSFCPPERCAYTRTLEIYIAIPCDAEGWMCPTVPACPVTLRVLPIFTRWPNLAGTVISFFGLISMLTSSMQMPVTLVY